MFWKIFFILNLSVVSISVFDLAFHFKDHEFGYMDAIQYASLVWGSIGLYGLAYKRKIFNYQVWLFSVPPMFVIDTIYPGVLMYLGEDGLIFSDGVSYFVVGTLVFFTIFIVVYYFGLLKYVKYLKSVDKNHKLDNMTPGGACHQDVRLGEILEQNILQRWTPIEGFERERHYLYGVVDDWKVSES